MIRSISKKVLRKIEHLAHRPWFLVLLIVILTPILKAQSCGDDPPTSGNEGAFILGIRTVLPDNPYPTLSGGMGETLEGLSGLRATVIAVDVVHRTDKNDPSTERLIKIFEDGLQIELIGNLKNLAPRQIGYFLIPEGYVYQIRLYVADPVLYLRGEEHIVKIPSSLQSGLKIEPIDGVPFEIIKDERTGGRIVFNPFERLIRNNGVGFILKPVLEAEHAEISELSPILQDRFVVKFHDDVSEARIQEINDSFGVKILYGWKPANYYSLKLPASLTLEDALRKYDKISEVEIVLPETLVETSQVVPNDPGWPNQPQWVQTEFDDAWLVGWGDYIPVVAVVDTGVDLDHPDLINNIFINSAEIPQAVLNIVGDQDGDGDSDLDDIDFNGDRDGVITFADLNTPANLALGFCPVGNNPPFALCDPLDIVDGTMAPPYGWQNGIDDDDFDNDPNTFVDDLVGWNFDDPNIATGNNLPVEASGPRTAGAHGTHVAGVIAAVGNNAQDLTGTNWRVRVLPLRYRFAGGVDKYQTFRSSTIEAINYASSLGADVINLSSGFYVLGENAGRVPADCATNALVGRLPTEKYNELLDRFQDELDNVMDLGTSLFVTIAHNCPWDMDVAQVVEWPGSFKNNQFLVVASVDAADNISIFSAQGQTFADIAAPGEDFQMLDPNGGNTNICNQAAGDCDGTSFAAPMVAGAAALVLSLNPGLSGRPCNIADHVLRNAVGVMALGGMVDGRRRLDADRAVNNVQQVPVRVCPP